MNRTVTILRACADITQPGDHQGTVPPTLPANNGTTQPGDVERVFAAPNYSHHLRQQDPLETLRQSTPSSTAAQITTAASTVEAQPNTLAQPGETVLITPQDIPVPEDDVDDLDALLQDIDMEVDDNPHQHTEPPERDAAMEDSNLAEAPELLTLQPPMLHSYQADFGTHACPLFVALRMLSYAKWTPSDANSSLDWHLLCAVAHDALQTDPLLRKPTLDLLCVLDPQTAKAVQEQAPIPFRDALELYDQLCLRLGKKRRYVASVFKTTHVCHTCSGVSQQSMQLNTFHVHDCVEEQKDAGIDTNLAQMHKLVTEGLQQTPAITCSTCEAKTIFPLLKLDTLADVFVFVSSFDPIRTNDVFGLPAMITRSRGGKVAALQLKATLYFRSIAGEEHYLLKEYNDDGTTSFYDPLFGKTDVANLVGCVSRAHIYISTDGKPNLVSATKLPPFNHHKLHLTCYRQPKTKATEAPTLAPQAKKLRTSSTSKDSSTEPDNTTTTSTLLTRRIPPPPKPAYALLSLFDGLLSRIY